MQRFGLPSAITSLGLGSVAGIWFHAFHGDSTVELFGTLGIVGMFLFAGLEVEFSVLQRSRGVLLQHIALQISLVALSTLVCGWIFHLEPRAAVLFSLALFTPSTGFILDSLSAMGLSPEEQYWVKAKAIASELVALGILFFSVQSVETPRLILTTLALISLVALLPAVFRAFDNLIAPFAPRTEFSFLILTALLCAYVTRELGVYYLVGAFVVGLTAVRMRRSIPNLSSHRLTSGVELFASFFIPFYFFKSGLHLQAEQFSLKSLGIGVALLIVVIPIRIFRVAAHRRWVLHEPWALGVRIGTAVVPTLVFTIVLAEILSERFGLAPELFGALMVFTLVNTLIPGFTLRIPPPDFETLRVAKAEDQL